jgi:methionyl-tRNA formyltransferase
MTYEFCVVNVKSCIIITGTSSCGQHSLYTVYTTSRNAILRCYSQVKCDLAITLALRHFLGFANANMHRHGSMTVHISV